MRTKANGGGKKGGQPYGTRVGSYWNFTAYGGSKTEKKDQRKRLKLALLCGKIKSGTDT